MKKFLWEMLHGLVHLFLPIMDRVHRPSADKIHDITAKKAFPEGE
jgi:hypothetical protein